METITECTRMYIFTAGSRKGKRLLLAGHFYISIFTGIVAKTINFMTLTIYDVVMASLAYVKNALLQ